MTWWNQIRDLFKNLNLFFKFQVAMFLVAIVTLSVMGFFSYDQGRKLLSERSFDLLINITKNKKRALEEYFTQIRQQVLAQADNAATLQALLDFQKAFQTDSLQYDRRADSILRYYYEKDYLRTLTYNSLQPPKENLIPATQARRYLQYKYLATNPNPDGFKHLLLKAPQDDAYDRAHARYHGGFRALMQQFAYEDILLLDARGNVVYSTAKHPDFADNMYQGAYRNTHLARIFKRLIKSREEEQVRFEDYENYAPAAYHPVCLVGTPIFASESGNIKRKVGVLVVMIGTQKVSDILSNKQDWQGDGLGASGESVLIGSDYKVRNNTRSILQQPDSYLENLRKAKVDSIVLEKIRRLKTTVLLREYKVQATIDALAGKSGSKTNTDFLGNEVLDVYMPVNILGANWAIITEMNGAEMFASTIIFGNQLLIISIVLFVGITILGAFLARSLAEPMLKIQREIKMLAEGEFPKLSRRIYRDELGKIDASLNTLITNMREVANFADNIGQSNFDYEFEAKSQKDVLGFALLRMRDNLRRISEEERERNWINSGKAHFAELLRLNSQSIEQLGRVVIGEIIQYLQANQGAIFVYEEVEQILRSVGAYAYDKQKYLSRRILPGEGLVGQAFLEGQYIYLTDIPADYSAIASGLGQAKPRCVIVLPLKTNERSYGVLEIASFQELEPYRIRFLESVAEDIATTIANIRVNEETKRLLAESQRATEQLRQQEEEMRQNFEELMATQEEMRQRQEKLEQVLQEYGMADEVLSQATANRNGIAEAGRMDKLVREAVNRQKELLEQAYARNQAKEDALREKFEDLE